MVKVYPNEVNLFQLGQIGATPGIRTGTTPFGQPVGAHVRYIGRSVAWKGVRKTKDESLEEYLRRLGNVNPEVARGLRNAINVSMKYQGVTGVALVTLANGMRTILPRKVVEQMRGQGKPVSVISIVDMGAKAKEVRQKFGIKGLYKGIAGAGAGGVMVPAPM